MRKRMFVLALCLMLALTLIPAAVSAASNIRNAQVNAAVGDNVLRSFTLSTGGSIDDDDEAALRELGLNGSVSGKELTVSGTAAKAGEVLMHVSDIALKIRVIGPELPPKTGDENMPLLFAGLALLSLAGLAFAAKRVRG